MCIHRSDVEKAKNVGSLVENDVKALNRKVGKVVDEVQEELIEDNGELYDTVVQYFDIGELRQLATAFLKEKSRDKARTLKSADTPYVGVMVVSEAVL